MMKKRKDKYLLRVWFGLMVFLLVVGMTITVLAAPVRPVPEEEKKEYSSWGVLSLNDSRDQRIEALLRYAQSLDPRGGNLGDVFKKMSSENIGFNDLIAFKADYQNMLAEQFMKEGMSGADAGKKASECWNEKYRPIERKIVNARRNLVKLVWSATLMEYMKKYPDSSILAKGDIGGWARETIEQMRFEGDIDFTIFAVESEHAVQLRDMFEKGLKKNFGMDMRQFDAFCTAHGHAEFDVYIGEWGAKWGELDMAERGKAQMYDISEDGTIIVREVPAKELLKIYHKQKGTFSADTFSPTADMEPGISLELLRHIKAEVFAGKFSTVERLIKMAKYLNRSAGDHKKFLGSGATTKYKRIAVWAQRVTEAKQNSSNSGDIIDKVFALTDGMLGKGWADDPVGSIEKVARRCELEMEHNVAEAIDYHKKRINNIPDEEGKARERDHIKDVLETEKIAYDHDGVKFPDAAETALSQVRGIDAARSFFGEKSAEYVRAMSDKANGAKMAMAYVLKKADNNIDRVNNFLDYLDNKTVEKLRNSDISIKVVDGDRVLHEVSIGSLNRKLNDSILGRIGNNTAFKAFNLAEEAGAYYNAYALAKTDKEAFRNMATEIFRRRVPGGGIAEAVIMENYMRAGLEVTYLVFPPLAIPEAILTLGYQAGSAGVVYGKGLYWQSSLEEISEGVYLESVFNPVEGYKGAKWKLVKLGYGGKKYDVSDLQGFIKSRDADGWWFKGWVGQVFSKATETDPVLSELRKLMSNSLVGETYRAKLQEVYDKRQDNINEAFLKQLIVSVEERWAAYMLGKGQGSEKIKKVRDGLACGLNPLVKETGNEEVDGELYRQAILDYKTHTEAVVGIKELSKKIEVKLGYMKPVCSLDSLSRAAERNVDLEKRYKNMLADIMVLLKDIKGKFSWIDKTDKKDLSDLLEYRKLAEQDLSIEYDLWKEKYLEAVKAIKDRYIAKVEDIIILPDDSDIFEGDKVFFEAKMELEEKEDVTYAWEISGIEYKGLLGKTELKGELETVSDGTLTLSFKAKRAGKVIGERKEGIEVFPVEFDSLRVEAQGNTTLSGESSSVQLKAIAEYSDESEADVTEYVCWEITDGENVAVDAKGEVTLSETTSYTPSGNETVTVKGTYEESSDEIEITVELELEDLGSYWETDPKYPEIPAESDPRGIMVNFKVLTDDPSNNHKRKIKWLFSKGGGVEAEMEGEEVQVFYPEMGQYGVLLTVTDAWGNIDEEHDTIVIEEEDIEEVEEEEAVEEVEEKEKLFETPTGQKNMYRALYSGNNAELLVKRYDWKTPLNKKASFVEGKHWRYPDAGYFNESTCLKTGPIASGTVFNPGYLIYYDANSKGIRYSVLGTGQETIHSSVFVKEKPDYSHSGLIRESIDTSKPESIRITDVLSRSFRVAWTGKDGKEYIAIVWKYDDHGGYTFEGTKVTEPVSLLVKEVTAELSEMYGGERDQWMEDKELISMVEKEIKRIFGEEQRSYAGDRPPKKVDKEQVKKKVSQRIEKGEKVDLLFVKGDGSLKIGKKLGEDKLLEDEYTYSVRYISTRPLPTEQAVLFCTQNNIHWISGEHRIVGQKYGDIFNYENASGLVDIWEIGILQGKRSLYNEAGRLYLEVTYQNGVLNGPFRFFNRFGWERGTFVNGEKQGPVGIYNRFDGGSIIGKGFYRNNRREGQWTINVQGRTVSLKYQNDYIIDAGPNPLEDEWLEDCDVLDLM